VEEDRRANRTDIAALAVEVGRLGASVTDLHNLILDSLIKSEAAITKADAAPSKLRVYGLVALSVLLSLMLAGGGIYTAYRFNRLARDSQETQYQNCLVRNQAQRDSAVYLARLNIAVAHADQQGSILAHELRGLLVPHVSQPFPDCKPLKP
jgi:hypothetical protein